MIIDRTLPTKPNIPTDGIRIPRKTLVKRKPSLLVISDTCLDSKNPHFSSHSSVVFGAEYIYQDSKISALVVLGLYRTSRPVGKSGRF